MAGAEKGAGVAGGLLPLDMGAFFAGAPARRGSGQCPVCSKGLKPFRDPLLPKDASIKRCQGCAGLWLNRGELKQYTEHRAKIRKNTGKMAERPATPMDPEAVVGGGPELKTLLRLQKELNAGTLTARDDPPALMLDASPIDSKEFVKDVGFLILQALLRLVFKI